MSCYKTCPHCGAHLDAGEVCDCQSNAGPAKSQTSGNLDKSTAPGASDTESGKQTPQGN